MRFSVAPHSWQCYLARHLEKKEKLYIMENFNCEQELSYDPSFSFSTYQVMATLPWAITDCFKANPRHDITSYFKTSECILKKMDSTFQKLL